MKRRLYFMLPNVADARAMQDDLLIAHVELRHMHFFAKEDTLPKDMPEANLVQRTDLIHGLETGVMIGACSGLIAGSLFMIFPPKEISLSVMILLVSTIFGALLGSWASARTSSHIPNSKLMRFRAGVEAGQVLLMVDVPLARVKEIEMMILRDHPQAAFGGSETHVPVFS